MSFDAVTAKLMTLGIVFGLYICLALLAGAWFGVAAHAMYWILGL